MLLLSAEGQARRELTGAELAALPQQVVYRSPSLRRLTVHGVRVTALAALFPSLHAVTVETGEGERRRLAHRELETAVLAYRLDHGPLSAEMGGPFRLLLEENGRLVSVSSVKAIHLCQEVSRAA